MGVELHNKFACLDDMWNVSWFRFGCLFTFAIVGEGVLQIFLLLLPIDTPLFFSSLKNILKSWIVLTSSGHFKTTSFVGVDLKWSLVMNMLGLYFFLPLFWGVFLVGVGELVGAGGAFLFLVFTSDLEKNFCIFYFVFVKKTFDFFFKYIHWD